MARTGRGDSQKSTAQSRRQSAATATSGHTWQQERAARSGRPTSRRTLWRRMRVALLLLFGVLGGAGLLVLLLHREVQFPFVTVVKTAYRSPFPPNGWAYEDLESFRSGAESLHGKTIDVVDFSEADRTAGSLLLPAPDQRRQVLNPARQTGVIVFYVSLHGLVDDDGRACLAAPDASPFESKTWLPVTQLLRQIRSWDLPDRVHKLLV